MLLLPRITDLRSLAPFGELGFFAFYLIQNMPRIISNSTEISQSGATDDLLTRNWQTTTAVAVGVGTGGLLTGVSLIAAPAQTVLTGAGIGSLAYIGHRRFTHDNKPIGECLPFGKQDESQPGDNATNITPQAEPIGV